MSDTRKPVEVADVIQRDRMFGHDANGRPIIRQAVCECGKSFTQCQLSERFMAIVERRGGRALELMRRDVPDYFVPVHCPPCERIDLGQSQRRTSYLDYLDRPEAAD